MSEVGKSMRRYLSIAVNSAWVSDDGFSLKNELKKIAVANIEKGYERCVMDGSKPIASCYKDVADSVKLGNLYRRAWGRA